MKTGIPFRIFWPIGLAMVFGSCLVRGQTEERRAKPNVVFFLADDLGWTDLGCFGSSFYDTPHLDRLAAEGMRFTNAYAACPVCSPTRASILTGKYPSRLGITTYINPGGGNQPEQWKRNTKLLPAPYRDHLALEETTLAEALRAQGYRTFFAGKWHLGNEGQWPEDQGFEVNMGGIERGGPYGGNRYFSPYGNPRLPDGPEGEHLPDRLAKEAVKFMEAHREEPFLAYVSFYSVHTPLMAREDLKRKYEKRKAEKDYSGSRFVFRDGRPERQIQDHPTYAGMVEAMDQAVGTVLEGVERLGLKEDTFVFFMSDNGGLSTSEGWPTSNRPLRAGKGWMYEGGIREPMIVKWPGVTEPGSVCEDVITSTDFYPTILEAAGLPFLPQQHVDGRSFVPLLRGDRQDRGPIFWHFPHYGNQGGSPSAAVRAGDWKLIWRFEDDRVELYNVSIDLSETRNVSEAHPEKCQDLKTAVQRFMKETGAKRPAVNASFDAEAKERSLRQAEENMEKLEQQHAAY